MAVVEQSHIEKSAMMSNEYYFTVWMECQSKYDYLKQQFIEISTPYISSMCLVTLKKNYDSIINSKRDGDSIKNLSDLLRILENRTVLCYNKIEPLKSIASEIVKDSILDRNIYEYEMNVQSQPILPLFNIYKYFGATSTSKAAPTSMQIQKNKNHDTTHRSRCISHDDIQQVPSSNEATSFNTKQQKIVFKKLSEDLDRYWRDLARLLDVKESEIDEIDRNGNFQLHDKAFKALEIFGKRSEPSTWSSKLIHSLIIVRRRDLTYIVDELLNTNN